MLTWVVYALAGLVLLAAVVSAILAGFALRFATEFLRGLDEGSQEEDDAQGVRKEGG